MHGQVDSLSCRQRGEQGRPTVAISPGRPARRVHESTIVAKAAIAAPWVSSSEPEEMITVETDPLRKSLHTWLEPMAITLAADVGQRARCNKSIRKSRQPTRVA